MPFYVAAIAQVVNKQTGLCFSGMNWLICILTYRYLTANIQGCPETQSGLVSLRLEAQGGGCGRI